MRCSPRFSRPSRGVVPGDPSHLKGFSVASPFAVFRRNQKVALAILTILSMVGFVFLEPIMKLIGGTNAPENPVVVETRYGNFTERDVQAMRGTRDLLDLFLRKVTVETVKAQINKGLRDPRDEAMAQQEWYGTYRAVLLQRTNPGPEAAAIETYVLAKTAERAGMMISDRAVNDFLRQLSADVLAPQQIEALIANLQPGRTVSVSKVFDAIRTELMAAQFRQMFAQSLKDFPPEQRFAFYSRLNRRAKAELMPVAVADFADQVADPSAEEVQKLYDKHKNDFPNPASPDPGFKQPKRAAFQYFKADFAKFEAEAKPLVTEEEIRDYYEKNKGSVPRAARRSGCAGRWQGTAPRARNRRTLRHPRRRTLRHPRRRTPRTPRRTTPRRKNRPRTRRRRQAGGGTARGTEAAASVPYSSSRRDAVGERRKGTGETRRTRR